VWGPLKLQFNLIESRIRPSAAGPSVCLLGDFLRLDREGGGEAGRGQFGGLGGGRVVGQALERKLPGQGS